MFINPGSILITQREGIIPFLFQSLGVHFRVSVGDPTSTFRPTCPVLETTAVQLTSPYYVVSEGAELPTVYTNPCYADAPPEKLIFKVKIEFDIVVLERPESDLKELKVTMRYRLHAQSRRLTSICWRTSTSCPIELHKATVCYCPSYETHAQSLLSLPQKSIPVRHHRTNSDLFKRVTT